MINIDKIINECYVEEGVGDTLRGIGLAAGLAASPIVYSNIPDKDNTVQKDTESDIIPIDYKSLYNYISKNEGKGKPGKPGYMYKDSKGLKTIGIGHLITKNTPDLFKKLFEDDKIDINSVLSGKEPLTDQQMQKLFEHDIQSKLSIIKRQLPDFMKYPQYVKNAIVDGYFRGDLSGSPKTKQLIKDGKWEEAAKEYLNFGDYKRSVQLNQQGKPHGVAKRMERNRDMFTQYAKLQSSDNEDRKVTKANLDDVKKQLGDKYTDVINYFNKKYSGNEQTDNVKSYIIKKGDTLYALSKKFNIPLKTILQNNPNINPKALKIRDTINI